MSNGVINGAGCLRGLLRLIETHFENIFGPLSEIRTPGTVTGSYGTKKLLLKKLSWEVSRVWVVRFGGYLGKKWNLGV